MNKKQNSSVAVSEVLGMVMLLVLAVIASAGLYISVLSDEGPSEETFVKIKGFVEGKYIIMEHQGGEAIPDDSWISIKLPDSTPSGPISIFLNDLNDDGKWNIGERLTQQFTYDLNRLDEYISSEIIATDKTSNSIELMGAIEFKPISDAGVTVTVNNPTPSVGEEVQITITITSFGGDVDGSGGIKVRYFIPDSLAFIDCFSPSNHGSYTTSSGIWDAGNVLVGAPAVLKINCTVNAVQQTEFVQVAMILDGSGSISDPDWNLMRTGLSNSIKDADAFPHDGSVELTVIQFGVGYNHNQSRVEIPPTLITASNYQNIANKINNLSKGNGGTPMAAGIYLAMDTMYNSINFSKDDRQVFILVTDGRPTYYSYPVEYFGRGDGYYTDAIDLNTTEVAVNRLVTKLELNDEKDEFNALAVGSGPDINWLNESIIWPQPGYIAPPFTNGSGWVSHVTSWSQFVERISEIFRIIFYSISNSIQLISSTTIDFNNINNQATLIISPE
ncbi:MAG: VWA domain-containing protein [Thermoplasmatota archaeon]